MEFKFDSNDQLTVISTDEKMALVICNMCGHIGKVRREDVYYANRHNIYVSCPICNSDENFQKNDEINLDNSE